MKELTKVMQPTVQFKHIALLAVEGTTPGADKIRPSRLASAKKDFVHC